MDAKVWLIAIGIVLVIEGTPYLVAPGGMKRMMGEMLQTPDRILRTIGLVAVAAGFGLLAWLRFSG